MSKIDFVISWVNGDDIAWRKKKEQYHKETELSRILKKDKPEDVYYRDWGILRFLLRSIETYAPWVNHIYLLTDKQRPDWLKDGDTGKLTVVDHEDFIPKEYLPTFHSHTVELNMHRIPGLSEQFVYFNDDYLLTHPVKKTDFFKNGLPVDIAVLNGINSKDEEFASIQFACLSLMNSHYSTSDCRRNLRKWLNPLYGDKNLRTILLLPFDRIQGIYNPHGPMPLLKSTCEKVWERDRDILDYTCRQKVRAAGQVSPYVFRYDQLLSGKFVPGRARNGYLEVTDPVPKISASLADRKYLSVCINDKPMDERSFEKRIRFLNKILKWKYPERGSMEKKDV